MEQMVEGSYKQFQRPKLVRPLAYSRFSKEQSAGQEIVLGRVKLPTPHNHIMEKIRLKPVYVTEDANELVYNSRMMEKGKKYYVTWCGEHFMLVRNDDGVAVYRFEADENEAGD